MSCVVMCSKLFKKIRDSELQWLGEFRRAISCTYMCKVHPLGCHLFGKGVFKSISLNINIEKNISSNLQKSCKEKICNRYFELIFGLGGKLRLFLVNYTP